MTTRKTVLKHSYLVVTLTMALSLSVNAEEYEFPRLLAIGASGTATGSFASSNGWAPILQDQEGINVRIIPVDSEINRFRRLTERKDILMSSVSASELRAQTQGMAGYAGISPAKQYIIWHHIDTPWGIVARGDSKLNSIEDLKEGDVLVSNTTFSPNVTINVTHGLPAFLGISPDDAEEIFSFVPTASYVQNCRSVVERKADIAFCSPISSVMAEMEGAPGGIKWLSMDISKIDAWARFLDYRPAVIPTSIDVGVNSARGIGGFTSNFLYAVRQDTSEEFAYNMAKWFHKSFNDYNSTHPLNARMDVEVFRKFLDRNPVPVHEGTVRYLKEIGMWTEEDDAWNEKAAQKMDRWVDARQAALEEARKNRVQAAYDNPEYIKILEKHTEGLEDFRSRL